MGSNSVIYVGNDAKLDTTVRNLDTGAVVNLITLGVTRAQLKIGSILVDSDTYPTRFDWNTDGDDGVLHIDLDSIAIASGTHAARIVIFYPAKPLGEVVADGIRINVEQAITGITPPTQTFIQQLASTDNGLGASLVGFEGGTTVQAELEALNTAVSAVTGLGFVGAERFTSSGTFTTPTDATDLFIEVYGAGGGGGGGTLTAGGGAGGNYVSGWVKVSDLPATVAITVGDGGLGGASISNPANDGTAGGISRFATGSDDYRLTATGGGGGKGDGTGGIASGTASAGPLVALIHTAKGSYGGPGSTDHIFGGWGGASAGPGGGGTVNPDRVGGSGVAGQQAGGGGSAAGNDANPAGGGSGGLVVIQKWKGNI